RKSFHQCFSGVSSLLSGSRGSAAENTRRRIALHLLNANVSCQSSNRLFLWRRLFSARESTGPMADARQTRAFFPLLEKRLCTRRFSGSFVPSWQIADSVVLASFCLSRYAPVSSLISCSESLRSSGLAVSGKRNRSRASARSSFSEGAAERLTKSPSLQCAA